jgi:hypothetical protein
LRTILPVSLATELLTADVPVAAMALSEMGPPGEILGGFSFLGTGGVTVDAQAFRRRCPSFSASSHWGQQARADAALAMRSSPCITPAAKPEKRSATRSGRREEQPARIGECAQCRCGHQNDAGELGGRLDRLSPGATANEDVVWCRTHTLLVTRLWPPITPPSA